MTTANTVQVTENYNTVEIADGPTVSVPVPSVNVLTAGTQGPQGAGFTGVKGGHLEIRNVINDTFTLQASAREAYTINGLYALKTAAGTVTITIAINGTPVTGLENIAVTTTSQDVTATALNSVAVGDEVTLITTNNSSASKLKFSLDGTV
jgi:hypothetical protein